MNGEIYRRYAKGRARKSPLIKDGAAAFCIGGLICVIGQAMNNLYSAVGLSQDNASMMTSVTLVFCTAVLTGLGYFDRIAKCAGGGTLVPITGFANAIAAAAVDNKSEGFVLGVGAKIFTIAGPVILYGLSAGVIYGLIYWLVTVVF